MVERGINEQFCYRDHYKLGIWMSRTLEDRRGRLRGKMVIPEFAPVWNPEARVTMGNDMETRYHVMERLSEPLGPEWEVSRPVIEQKNKKCWSRNCGLWNRPDLRPKVEAKQMTSIVAHTIQMNAPNAIQEQLDAAIPPVTNNDSKEATELSQTPTSQEIRVEHSPEPLIPTSVVNLLDDDDVPHTPEGAVTP